MPQYLDRLTPTEVRECIKDLEKTLRKLQKRKDWNAGDYIMFAPKQVILTLRAEVGSVTKGTKKVHILNEFLDVRVGTMPDIRKKFGYMHRT